MPDRPTITAGAVAAVDAVLAALDERSPNARAAALDHVTADVEVFGPFGVGHGPEAVAAMLEHPAVARFLTGTTWSPSRQEGRDVLIDAVPAPGGATGGFHFRFRIDTTDGRISRIEQDLVTAAPPEPSPLALTDAHAALLSGALDNGTPMIVGYGDPDGRPHLSYRAAVLVLGPQQLGMWVRDPTGGLLHALRSNPHLTFFYSDRAKGVTLQFLGRGRVDTDETIRHRVYDGSPAAERNMDWRRQGQAVVVDLDRVEGRDAGGRVLMVR